ncbi:MAG: hypothetical protein DME09_07660 [Candidatus Rokuibacteriota bacterium]|nr:MAG: hypothetical protein DME09_07660 [Candidatus Rokubacteria bacterium]
MGWIFKVVPAINPAGVAVLLIGENVRPALAVAHRTSAARRLAARPRGAGPEPAETRAAGAPTSGSEPGAPVPYNTRLSRPRARRGSA